MAAVPNIAPQTPSDKYGIVDVSGEVRYILLKSETYSKVSGAKSRCFVDFPYYDASTYRDITDASVLGRAPMDMTWINAAFVGLEFTNNGDYILPSTTPVEGTPIPDQIASMMSESDPFTKTPPHQTVLGRTQIQWWDTTGATGMLVGACWADQYVDEGTGIPQFIGFAPPSDP